MNVWFLTIVQDGHVNLTSIMAESYTSASHEVYAEFKRLFGNDVSWAMTESVSHHTNSTTITTWELENQAGSWIKASLIKA